MRGINSVFLVGRAGTHPELRSGKSGLTWCALSIATHRNVRGPEGEWVEETDWHDVRLFGEHAERCGREVERGCRVAVEGSLTYDAWIDEGGNRRKSTRILASAITVVGAPSAAVIAEAAAPRVASTPGPEEPGERSA